MQQGPEGGRHVAAGGWRRVLAGLVVGVLAGAAIAMALPRDDGPRRPPPADDHRDPAR